MRDNSARRVRWFPTAAIAVVLAVLAGGGALNLAYYPQPALVADGVPHRSAQRAKDLRTQALNDLDALTLPSGATLAGWDGPWRYVWPRDASFVAAARCSVGQYAEAARVLDFLDRIKPTSGRWEARYLETGRPVADSREPQLDGSGWVPWATWFCRTGARHWDMVRQSADHITQELGANGLPQPSPDYWERPESEVTLGTVAPLLTGLRAAIRIATELGHTVEAERWQAALTTLSTATEHRFAPDYPRTPAYAESFLEPGLLPACLGGGADAIVTVLGPPFAPERHAVSQAIDNARAVSTQPNGGQDPGEEWRADGVAWTPQTALFALSAAARGDRRTAEQILSWLDHYRTPSGSLPEKVNRDRQPAGEAPLGWTAALVVLAGQALDKPLPIP
ncbi:glucoamylase [Kribbella sp. NPDC005582]|uniref:glucoamylase n=1 Tax=Kribbella sp. NPDC005582 TaxID=3156893 RepID=UPI0033AFB5A8